MSRRVNNTFFAIQYYYVVFFPTTLTYHKQFHFRAHSPKNQMACFLFHVATRLLSALNVLTAPQLQSTSPLTTTHQSQGSLLWRSNGIRNLNPDQVLRIAYAQNNPVTDSRPERPDCSYPYNLGYGNWACQKPVSPGVTALFTLDKVYLGLGNYSTYPGDFVVTVTKAQHYTAQQISLHGSDGHLPSPATQPGDRFSALTIWNFSYRTSEIHFLYARCDSEERRFRPGLVVLHHRPTWQDLALALTALHEAYSSSVRNQIPIPGMMIDFYATGTSLRGYFPFWGAYYFRANSTRLPAHITEAPNPLTCLG